MAGREIAVQVQEAGGISRFIAAYSNNLARVAPKHVDPDTFIGLAAAAVARSPKLTLAAQANPAALIAALRECASLGHVVGKDSYVLTPFQAKSSEANRTGWDITGIEVYKGVLERMFRAGGVRSVHVELVRQGDAFRPGRPGQLPDQHDFAWDAPVEERGPLIGVYAWAVMLAGGPSHVILMNRYDVAKHRNVSKSGAAFWGPAWPDEGPWTPDMWRKTALHKLEPYVPTSAAYRWELAQAANAGTGWQGVPDRPLDPANSDVQDVQDAEVVDDGPRGADWPDTAQPPDAGKETTS